ncbi:hypothetical protein BDW22DRAFT_1354668 [Trametopsis cervina]|nr:hypothetical protein BDW22DRAFT_1354668 [Trametopsis cervina]
MTRSATSTPYALVSPFPAFDTDAPTHQVSANPPLLSISFTLGKNRPKDSRENILSTKQFTVNIISEPFIEAANASAVEAPAHIDEWLVSGLTPEPSVSIAVPRVQESAVSFECELFKHIDIAAPESDEPTTTLILGLIKRVHVCKAVLRDDGRTVDPGKLRPVARLDGGLYSRMGEAFELPRPSWRAWKDKIEEMHRSHPPYPSLQAIKFRLQKQDDH